MIQFYQCSIGGNLIHFQILYYTTPPDTTHSTRSIWTRSLRITKERGACLCPYCWQKISIYRLTLGTAHCHTNLISHYRNLYSCRLFIYIVIQKDGLNWTVNGTSTHARQLVAVFQVLCSLYGLTCVGYAQNSLEFFSRSPLIHVVGRSFCLYTDSLFAQIGDSNDKCSSSLDVECLNEDETHAAQQWPTLF